MMKASEKLSSHEWIVVFSLIALMSTMTYATHKHWFKSSPTQNLQRYDVYDLKINVKVEGAVDYPGVYCIDKGSCVEDVLLQAKPSTNADVNKISKTKKVRDGQIIKIPAKEYITIYLEGAVEHPGALILPKGATMAELISLVEVKKNADLSQLKRDKRLKEGDIIKIPQAKHASTTSCKASFTINT